MRAIALDAVALVAFVFNKWKSDPMIVVLGLAGMTSALLFECFFLARSSGGAGVRDHH
ncbi:hypothetical protein [Brevundimonas sp.]|uniref:hypothetical protein n=1 Tax=Brevundimonas sp. TaxID=1871086 RepID=UPI00356321B2